MGKRIRALQVGTLALVRRLWASPYTLIGLAIGLLGLVGGGRVRRVAGVWECHGPLVRRLLDRLPLRQVQAITLGHTVLGRDAEALEWSREHERVHVGQFERWGPLMGPAYLGCSLMLWLRGRDWYRENPFEREAYASDAGQQDAWRRRGSV